MSIHSEFYYPTQETPEFIVSPIQNGYSFAFFDEIGNQASSFSISSKIIETSQTATGHVGKEGDAIEIFRKYLANKQLNYYVIIFLVTIESKNTYAGTTGTTNSTDDYKPNHIKKIVREHYQEQFPKAKSITINITQVLKVTYEEYLVASSEFILIK